MKAFKDGMADFKDEMGDFKKEMADFKEEARAQNREMNRHWAEIAHKMGTLAEDIVAPNLPRLARELFGCEAVDLFAVRMRKRWDGETREYDVIVACGDHVLVNETKSTLKSAHVDQMVGVLEEFREVFPEYRDKKLIGILASLYVDEGVVRRASSKGILVMGMGEETLEVLNKEAARPY